MGKVMRAEEAGDRAHPRWAEQRTAGQAAKAIGQSGWVPLGRQTRISDFQG